MKNRWMTVVIFTLVFCILFFGVFWCAHTFSCASFNYLVKDIPNELIIQLWQSNNTHNFTITNIHSSGLEDNSYILTFFVRNSDKDNIDILLSSLNITFRRLYN